MDGFLPLIEAFLAFALTMLGLATAVAALAGIWQRVFRWRAAVLRESLSTLYVTRVAPLLRELDGDAPSQHCLAEFIVEMTFLPVDYHEALGDDAPTADAGGHRLATTMDASGSLKAKRIHRVSECLGVPRGGALQRALQRMVRVWRGWKAARYASESLPAQQFAVRFAASTAGTRLAAARSDREWEQLVEALTQAFGAVGAGATEEFTRRCRVFTVSFSLLLAFAVNIDSFNLLNTYLTDPELRERVIERQAQLVAAAEAPADALALPVVTAHQARVAELAQRLDALAVPDALADVPGFAEAFAEVEAEVRAVRDEATALAAAADRVTSGVRASEAVAAQLVENFPIGWDRYPYCPPGPLADTRCLDVREALARASKADGEDAAAAVLPADFGAALKTTWRHDRAGLIEWFVGVLLSGLMAGLGAPFWVQVVNRVLKLRESIGGAAQGEEGGRRRAGEAGDGARHADAPSAAVAAARAARAAAPGLRRRLGDAAARARAVADEALEAGAATAPPAPPAGR